MKNELKALYALIEGKLTCDILAVEFARHEINFEDEDSYKKLRRVLAGKSLDYLETYKQTLGQLFDGFVTVDFGEVPSVYTQALQRTKDEYCTRFEDVTPELVDRAGKRFYKRMKKEFLKFFGTTIKTTISEKKLFGHN